MFDATAKFDAKLWTSVFEELARVIGVTFVDDLSNLEVVDSWYFAFAIDDPMAVQADPEQMGCFLNRSVISTRWALREATEKAGCPLVAKLGRPLVDDAGCLVDYADNLELIADVNGTPCIRGVVVLAKAPVAAEV